MRWSTVVVVATLALSGCNSSQYPSPDPFAWGNPRVPPPPTGSLGRTQAPYYGGPPANAVTPGTGTLNLGPPPTGMVPQLQVPSTGGVPHGAPATTWRSQAATDPLFTHPGAAPPQRLANGPAPTVAPVAMGAVVGSGLASAHQTPTQGGVAFVQPGVPTSSSPVFSSDRQAAATGSTAVLSAGGTQLNPMHVNDGTVLTPPRQFVPPQQAVDISTLPPAPAAMRGATNQPLSSYPIYANQTVIPAGGFVPHQTAGAVQAHTTHGVSGGSGAVAAAGWTANTSRATKTGPTGSSTNSAMAGQMGGYGYHGDYSWLKGKIEYSTTARQWKLRYIPRDASEHKIDDFGGSVILANNGELNGYSGGEFVRVEGHLLGRDGSAHGFAPSYQIARIQRQTQ